MSIVLALLLWLFHLEYQSGGPLGRQTLRRSKLPPSRCCYCNSNPQSSSTSVYIPVLANTLASTGQGQYLGTEQEKGRSACFGQRWNRPWSACCPGYLRMWKGPWLPHERAGKRDFENPEVGRLDSQSISWCQTPVKPFPPLSKQLHMVETSINGVILLRSLVNKYYLMVTQGTPKS